MYTSSYVSVYETDRGEINLDTCIRRRSSAERGNSVAELIGQLERQKILPDDLAAGVPADRLADAYAELVALFNQLPGCASLVGKLAELAIVAGNPALSERGVWEPHPADEIVQRCLAGAAFLKFLDLVPAAYQIIQIKEA